MATLVPKGSSVLEFGAGRMVLKDYLDATCKYTPSDSVDRGNCTFVCDLNSKTLPDFPKHDVAVFSGVLEYIHDIPRLLLHLSKYFDTVIVSYGSTDYVTDIQRRRAYGWVNDYTSQEFIAIFYRSGYDCSHLTHWASAQLVCKFTKRLQEGARVSQLSATCKVCHHDDLLDARK